MSRSIAVLSALVLLIAPIAVAGDEWREKVDPWVLSTAESGSTEFLVFLAEQAGLEAAEALETKQAKGRFVFETLKATADRTQGPVLETLALLGVEHRPYWIANMVWVRGGLDAVEAMARRPDVARVHANPAVRLDEPVSTSERDQPTEAVEWNIAKVNADDVWALGHTGDGVVVAGQDTGYRWDHPALVDQYRGSAGNHDYSWWDAIHSGGGSCGADADAPCDDHGHGTHTMGTIVGDDGGSNQVGMAPTAEWIGCRNMNVGVGTPTTYAECYQFFVAPTDLAGANPDPSMAPDVINNSWGCPPSEGCTDPNVLLTVVQNVRAAGIVTVHSAGNSGSSCSTVEDPSAIYDESFTVGATSSSDAIAYFSSRGPVTVDGSGRAKPDISAPGVDIRSSTRDGGYQGGWDGTSMAGPHVAGLVALLISAYPGLAGDVDLLEEMIEQTAVPRTSSQGCGGDAADAVPNNVYGWGRIDALAAVNYPLDFSLEVVPSEVAVCAPADAVVDVSVDRFLSFSEAVNLTVDGLPAGAGSGFAPNPVTPPGTSVLTVSGTGAAVPGTTTVEVVGTSTPSAIEHRAAFELTLADSIPAGVSPVTPADGATDVAIPPSLAWQPVAQAAGYRLEVASDVGFTQLVTAVDTDVTSLALDTVLDPETTYWWRVRATNACGDGPFGPAYSFTTRAIPPVLVVDDDDNSPDVRAAYTTALDALGQPYELWDTANSDLEPTAAELAPYRLVVWFTGDEFGGAAGPGSAGETALASWLDGPGECLLLSSQDYHYDRDLTPFMQTHLGLASVDDDESQTSVTGAGALFAGIGPASLSYPGSNFSDVLTRSAGAEDAFTGNQGLAAVDLVAAGFTTSFWAFPLEALPAADRQAALERMIAHCLVDPDVFADGFEGGDASAWSAAVQ